MENKKRTIAVLLLVMIGVASAGIFSYWVGQVGGPEDHSDENEITIGKAQGASTVLDVTKELANQGKKLVPKNKAALSVGGTADNVESYSITYDVYWKEDGDADAISADDNIVRTLNVSHSSLIEEAEAHNGLVNVTVDPESAQIIADGDPVKVTVTVTLTEPGDKAAYEAIIGQSIKVNLNFSVGESQD